VLNGATITGLEHFVARGVFVPGFSGRFKQPRVPYKISGASARPFAEPVMDADVDWGVRAGASGEWKLPLEGLRIVDCTGWWAGPMAPHMLACLGADVTKVESTAHPDGMRLVSTRRPGDDRWWEWGPMFHALNATKRGITLDLGQPEGLEILHALLEGADVLVENFTPRVIEQFGLDWDTVHALYPRLVMVRMPAFGLDGPWRDRTGFAQTMECISGMAWRTGRADGPPLLARGPGDPIAGTIAVIATLLALTERDRDGEGRLVESVMVEAALNAAAEAIVEYGATGRVLSRDANRGLHAAPQGVYQCAGDDEWVAIAVTTDEQWDALRKVTSVAARDRWAEQDVIDSALGGWCADQKAGHVESRLLEAGVPSAVVIRARDVLHNPQLQARGLFELERHPVTGDVALPALPFRFSRVAQWNRDASPTLGQHTRDVLAELGWADRFDELWGKGVIGDAV
jgi:crotonobetainyl-CoA:carnitine CoA-transferase CaiB-like acyl-CoA transferase